MGENGGKWGKMGENGEEMRRKWGERRPVAPPKFPYFPPFFPIPPHSPPISPIFPYFPPFFLAMGTLWVRLWVQYPPPERVLLSPERALTYCGCRTLGRPPPATICEPVPQRQFPPASRQQTRGMSMFGV